MRIIIDGAGLSGKSALVKGLTDHLEGRGLRVRREQRPLERLVTALLQVCRRTSRPASMGVLLMMGLCEAALSGLMPRRLREDEVALRESQLALLAAVAQAFGHDTLARWLCALQHLTEGDALRLSLTVSYVERVRRYLRRGTNTALDRLVLTEPERSLDVELLLAEQLHARGNRVINTDGRSVEVVRGLALHTLAGALPTPTSPRPLSQPIAA